MIEAGDVIYLYSDEDLVNCIGITLVGKVTSWTDVTGISNHSFGYDKPIGEQTYTLTGLTKFNVVTDSDSGQYITLPVTGDDYGYVYFSKTLRLRYKLKQIGVNRYSWVVLEYQFDNGNGFYQCYPDVSSSVSDAYEPIQIRVWVGTKPAPYYAGDYLNVSVRFRPYDSPSYTTYEQWQAVNHRDLLFIENDPHYRPTKTSVRGGNGIGYFKGTSVSPMGGTQVGAVLSRFISSTGFGLTYYKISDAAFLSFMAWLYQTGLFVDRQVARDAVLSCVYLPVTPTCHSSAAAGIYCSTKSFPAATWGVTNQIFYVDNPIVEGQTETYSLRNWGTNTFTDVVNCEVSVFLPFYGEVNIDPAAVFQGELYVRYSIDCRNGNIVYNIVTKSIEDKEFYVYGHYSGNCGIPIPMVGSGQSGTYFGKLEQIGATASQGVQRTVMNDPSKETPSGDLLASAAVGLVGGAVKGFIHANKPIIDKSGTVSPLTSQMDVLDIRINIARQIMIMSDNYKSIVGFPSAAGVRLGDETGFVKVKYLKEEDVVATEREKNEIISLLKEGVFL